MYIPQVSDPSEMSTELPRGASKANFWDARYLNRIVPWDAGAVPPALIGFESGIASRGRVLVPGCGSAYEARYFAERGWTVLAIDFSAAAIAAATAVLGPWSAIALQADFFGFPGDDAPFDAIYERAFLCALPRRLWQDYATRAERLLRPGSLLFGFFYFDSSPKGPPFGSSRDELDRLLLPLFECVADEPVAPADSIDVFRGKERWMEWRRR